LLREVGEIRGDVAFDLLLGELLRARLFLDPGIFECEIIYIAIMLRNRLILQNLFPHLSFDLLDPPLVPKSAVWLRRPEFASSVSSSNLSSSSYALLRDGQGTGQTYTRGIKLYTYAYIW